jgi:hypothetical protein
VNRGARACGLAAALAWLAGCAGEAGASHGAHDADVYDLMARKPDAAPPGAPYVGAPLKGRELQRGVARTVERQRPAFQACIERDSKGKEAARARATLLLTVRADGVVTDSRVAERSVHGTSLGRCLVGASRRMDGAPMQIRVPLQLSAQ